MDGLNAGSNIFQSICSISVISIAKGLSFKKNVYKLQEQQKILVKFVKILIISKTIVHRLLLIYLDAIFWEA